MCEDVTNVVGLYTFECAHNLDKENGPEEPRDRRSLKGL